ncbi:MAG: site-specific integrase [Candidatus Sericytochromatia bacterium]|nr:site-specific integrase [Candidatus Sericytochromatia bacterium]
MARSEGTYGEFVFSDTRGGLLRKSNLVRRSFQPLLEKAGLPRFRFHDLRHTHASFLLREGTSPKVVQEFLGHSRIDLTMDVYSHTLPTMQGEAAAKWDAALSGYV